MNRIQATNELAFRVGFSGHSGHLRVEPLYTVEDRTDPIKSLPDFILPPAFPRETAESIKEHIEDKYLSMGLDTNEFSPEKVGRQWDFDWFEMAKVPLEPSLAQSVVAPVWEVPFRRQKKQGKWEPNSVQVDVSELMLGAQDSGPLPRVAGPAKDFVRGSINSRPFRPGGLEDSQSLERILPDGASNGEWVQEILKGGPAQVVPPSFKQGLDLGELQAYPCLWNVYKDQDQSSLKSTSDEKLNELSVQFDDLFKKAWEEDVAEFEKDGPQLEPESIDSDAEGKTTVGFNSVKEADLSVLDEILSVKSGGTTSILDDGGGQQQKEAWVVSGSTEAIADRFHELVPDLALDFPFELDNFQKEAIYYLENGDSVFVAAHTSAGKTVVAEYAFALATKHCTRAVYTAPIKTISNQKYRDFSGKFDVGLLTGDVSLRPEASCLIMTTEILRSMLYRVHVPKLFSSVGSTKVPNTVEFADWIGRTKQKKIRVTGTTKRPVPLEHCLFYSGEFYKVCENEAFIPQGWKAAKDAYKRKNLSAASGATGSYAGASSPRDGARAQKREHPNRGKQNKHSGMQNSGNFSGSGWNQNSGGSQNNWGLRRSEVSIWLTLINKLSKKSLLPVVIFCFSKNHCDKLADGMSGIDLTSSSEKSEIRVFCDKAFSRLKGSDRNLPQIVRVQSLLRRGIAIHHAGLLPIVKEVIEMLFCRGVVKVLFSTETFAMGVNAPARTVVFDNLRKFDGREFRQLLPGEYTQMAGRAGRRGLDKIGTVVVLCRDEIPGESDLKHIIVGSATRLESQFRLTYIMILHLLRVEELKVEDMLKRSFAEFHSQKKLPEQQQLLMRKLAQPPKTIECIKGEPAIEEYYDMYYEAEKYNNQITEAFMQSAHQFLMPGRVLFVKSQTGQDHLLGAVVKAPSANNKEYIVMLLKPDLPSAAETSLDKKSGDFSEGYFVIPKSKRGLEEEYCGSVSHRKGSGVINIKLPYHGAAAGVSYEVRGIEKKELLCICNCKIKIDQVGLLEDVSSAAFSKTVQQLLVLKSDEKKYPQALDPVKGINIIIGALGQMNYMGHFVSLSHPFNDLCCGDPLSDLKLKDMNLVEAYYKWAGLLRKMAANKCHGCIKLEEHMKLTKENKRHKDEVNTLKFQMSDEALQQMPDFQGRIDVLKEIGCIDADLVVQIKGRVACEMNSGEELICTECLFENQLDDLEPEEAVAIMSAFVFQQRNTSEPSLTPKLSVAKERLYNTAIRLGELQAHFKVQIDPEEYARDNLKFGLVEVVYEWAKGTPFADICELTDVPEGLIVRTIVRLDETCREFRNAAAIMGNSALYKKMETASNAIKRDIVFAASLYITGV
ncbi:DExH-box ATP-dependent RNA helicase DExH11 [Citrus sinensis]|uniref:DExH-box ATP-dependent RNA helicase DExH11 n=1 Tax=Citrus sinensis TaxID=2711 RepID=A0ACB8IXC2_CITSI|nr:DExH-box ATP-dependent RNA helicase DExH11 [Citrus sinensis]